MAHIQECRYCSGGVVNSPWHPECRLAKLEDLLYRVRLEMCHVNGVSRSLKQEVLNETFRSKEGIEQERSEADQRRSAKVLWQIAHDAALRGFIEEWEKTNPDPDPPTY
ncbi:MAG: hypothetical protein CEO19_167 [Parcubacteria group bacterium Gr01-1014_73]|nr:MAG: hypothetical protein CEO19_167 [Parcubacteria group bacterium Gr01-1014_73]